jgi:lysozyme
MFTAKGERWLKKFEGLKQNPYKDVAGHWTVGWGHKMALSDDKERFYLIDECQKLFDNDSQRAYKGILANVKPGSLDRMNLNKLDALVSFVYNLGVGKLASSTLLKRINAGQFDAVPYELMRWVHAAGLKRIGLKRRRAAEATLWLGLSDASIDQAYRSGKVVWYE